MLPIRLALLTLTLTLAAPAAAEDVAAPEGTSAPLKVMKPGELQPSATAYEAAENPEKVSGAALMITAYSLVWLVLFGYLVTIRRRQEVVRGEIRDLAREVKDLSKSEGGSEEG